MKKIWKIFLLSLLTNLLNSTCFANDELTYFTENLPPYNFSSSNNIATGFNTDVLVLMFKKMGNDLTAKDIKVVPWARGYAAIKSNNKPVALYSTTRRPARENLFKWVGPLSSMENALIVLKDNPANVATPQNASDYDNTKKYGAVRDDSGLSVLKESNTLSNKNIQVVSDFNQLVKLLKAKRIDAFSYNKDVSLYNIEKMGLDTEDFQVIYSRKLGDHYIAFSKVTPDSVVEAHQKAFEEVMADKEAIDNIMSNYR